MQEEGMDAREGVQDGAWENEVQQRRNNLHACDATFKKWFGESFDLDTSRVVLATAAAERIVGDPLWLLLVGGPGTAKTETMCTLAVMDAEIVSTISSEGALVGRHCATKGRGRHPRPESDRRASPEAWPARHARHQGRYQHPFYAPFITRQGLGRAPRDL
jgi:hypothetical protein